MVDSSGLRSIYPIGLSFILLLILTACAGTEARTEAASGDEEPAAEEPAAGASADRESADDEPAADEWQLAPSAGSLNCQQVMVCIGDCTDEICAEACFEQGTPQAQWEVISWLDCVSTNCDEGLTEAGFVQCVEDSCLAETAACFELVPDHTPEPASPDVPTTPASGEVERR